MEMGDEECNFATGSLSGEEGTASEEGLGDPL
jgi:hypothetical protein